MPAKQVSRDGLTWYVDARFGMFIHWGLYALPAAGEWWMFSANTSPDDYRALAARFDPQRFDAEQWVGLAADAGQKYLVITSRHHDGFSMYDTALSDFKVTNTPFKRDPIDELAQVCARRGDVRLGFYASLLDWSHPAYRFRKESGLAWSDYTGFLHGQVRELCTRYGELACLWFDGDWPLVKLDDERAHFEPGGSFEYERLYDMIHTLQPHAIVVNNRHDRPLPGEDVQVFEQDLPGENTSGHNVSPVYDLPVEVVATINDHWGYNRHDHNHKSSRHLIHLLARSVAADANFLLNTGPSADGEVIPEHVERLRAVGHWLQAHGAAIYGARKGIVAASSPCVSTRRGDCHHMLLLDHHSDVVSVATVPEGISRATLMASGAPLEMSVENAHARITIPDGQWDPCCTVVTLT